MKVEYVVASKVSKEVVWLLKFLMKLRVVPLVVQPMMLFCDKSGVVALSREPRNH